MRQQSKKKKIIIITVPLSLSLSLSRALFFQVLLKERFIIQSRALSKPQSRRPKKRLSPSVVAVDLDGAGTFPLATALLDSHFFLSLSLSRMFC